MHSKMKTVILKSFDELFKNSLDNKDAYYIHTCKHITTWSINA